MFSIQYSQKYEIKRETIGVEFTGNTLNSLVPGRRDCKLKLVIFEPVLRIDFLNVSCKIPLSWVS